MEIQEKISNDLADTPFACKNLTQLSGGTANFVYRGLLSTPLPDGTTTVIIKHAEDFLASNEGFKLSAKRCLNEELALRFVQGMGSVTTTNTNPDGDSKYQVTAKAPKLYHFSASTNTQVMEDLPCAVDLKTFLRSPEAAQQNPVSREWAKSIGRTLGIWLRSFHVWGDDPGQQEAAGRFDEDETMKSLKFDINYNELLGMTNRYPDLLRDHLDLFDRIKATAAQELEKWEDETGQVDRVVGPIHGDFWSGNILIPSTALTQQTPVTPLFITDWELAQWGRRALDLGQMVAELYMLKHYMDIDAGLWIIEGFANGYASIPERRAFRTLIHAGVHLITFGSQVPGWGSEEQAMDLIKVGRDLLLDASKMEKEVFRGGPWECFFEL